MKMFVFAVAALAAAPALAQNAPAQNASAQNAPAQTASAAADHSMHAGHSQAAVKYSLDTPIAALVADAKAKAVLDANLPGLTTHQHFEMFKSMTLAQLAPMAGGQMPAEAVAKVQAELAAIQ